MCYRETTFDLAVNSLPTATTPATGLNLCDDDTDGIVTGFDLTTKKSEILGSQGSGYAVSYYNGKGVLITAAANYTNITNPETITARVTNSSTLCYRETTFDLAVNSLPTATTPATGLNLCTDGIVTGFDLTTKKSEILGSQGSGYAVSYYNGKGVLITAAANYTNITNPETITARVTNSSTLCYRETTFDLAVNSLPTATTPATGLNLCTDGIVTGFDLTTKKSEILGSQGSGYAVSYYNGKGVLITAAANYTNITNPETITARVTNSSTLCYRETTFDLAVNSLPTATTPATGLNLCTDGIVTGFDLTTKKSEILGSQGSGYAVSYYNGKGVLITAAANYTNITNPETITARVTNSSTTVLP